MSSEMHDVVEGIKAVSRRQLWVTGGQIVVCGMMIVIAFIGGTFFRNRLNELGEGDTPNSVRQRQRAAEMQFLICSRKSELIDPVLLEDRAAACRGYGTLVEAYETQGVPPRSS